MLLERFIEIIGFFENFENLGVCLRMMTSCNYGVPISYEIIFKVILDKS